MVEFLKRFAAYSGPHRGMLAQLRQRGGGGPSGTDIPIAMTLFIDQLLPSGLIALMARGLLAVYAASAALLAIVNYWGHALGIRAEAEMRPKAFDHLQKLSFGFFDNQKTGHLVARLTKDLEDIGELAHHGPEDVFLAVMTMIGAFILMAWVYWPLALITAVVLPPKHSRRW